MGIYSDFENIDVELGELERSKSHTNSYDIEIYDKTNKKDKIYIKSPKLFFRSDNEYELSLESDDFYKGLKTIENKIKQALILSDLLPFNEESLDDLYKSFLLTPPCVKMCPFLKLEKRNDEIIVYNKDNELDKNIKVKRGDKIQTIFEVSKISFEKSKWEIKLTLEAIKPIVENSQLSEYMFKDSEEYTNVVLDTECS